MILKSEQAMDRFRSAMTTVDELVGDPQVRLQLKQALAGMPQLMADAQSTLKDARQTLDGFQQMSQRANTNLENLERFTAPLAERGDELVGAIESSVTNIDQLLEQLVQFGEALNSREGTLGQLLHDRELYDRLQRTVGNVEDASRQLRPIMNDVRILTDKLATDPGGQLLKRAIDRRPIGTGTKWNWGEPETDAGRAGGRESSKRLAEALTLPNLRRWSGHLGGFGARVTVRALGAERSAA